MQFSAWCLARHDGAYRTLKAPGRQVPPAQQDPAVVARVTEMLATIEREGLDAVLRYAKELDHFDGDQLELDRADIARSGDALDPALRRALELGAERTRTFATAHRQALGDFDVELAPGLRAGYRYVPVSRVGAYLPAGRFPLLASAFMTVGVAKAAGVGTVLACTPPQPDGAANAAVLYTAHLTGADRVFVLGGVQALAAMAFGLLDEPPVDMLVGAGNAYVAEAKRQLFGARGDRPPRRPVGGRRHRRRHRRPRDRGRRPARPGRARPGLARRARHHLRGVRAGGDRRRRHASSPRSPRATSPDRPGATTARSRGPPTRRPPSH